MTLRRTTKLQATETALAARLPAEPRMLARTAPTRNCLPRPRPRERGIRRCTATGRTGCTGLASADSEELAAQRAALEDQRHQLVSRPPDKRNRTRSRPCSRRFARYDPDDLADLFGAFNITVTYDKPSHTPELAATVTAELAPAPERLQPPRRRSQNCAIAGAGLGQISPTASRTASPKFGCLGSSRKAGGISSVSACPARSSARPTSSRSSTPVALSSS